MGEVGEALTRRARCVPEARLAPAWNALRGGRAAEAAEAPGGARRSRTVDAATIRRVALASAAALYQLGQARRGARAPWARARRVRPRSTCARCAWRGQAGRCPRRRPRSRRSPSATRTRRCATPRCSPRPTPSSPRATTAARPRSSRASRARAQTPAVRAEAELRAAGARVPRRRARTRRWPAARRGRRATPATDVAARAQFLLGEVLVAQGPARRGHRRAATGCSRATSSTRWRPARSTAWPAASTRSAGAPTRPAATRRWSPATRSSPKRRPRPTWPASVCCGRAGRWPRRRYFQLVLDRYAAARRRRGARSCSPRPSTRSWSRPRSACSSTRITGPATSGSSRARRTLLLSRMPPSRSPWRAWALLIDADASAAQARYAEAQATPRALMRDFPDHPVGDVGRRSCSPGPTRGRARTASPSPPRSGCWPAARATERPRS